MKFLIQTIDRKIKHDFSFTLIQSIEYHNWLNNDKGIKYALTDCDLKKDYTPVGSIEFVHSYLEKYFGVTPTPINIPEELLERSYTQRNVFNGTNADISGCKFIKSNDKIKSFTGIINTNEIDFVPNSIPIGNYQISEVIDIQSEYRCFIYQNQLVGVQYYSGDFTVFPKIESILWMIKAYEKSAPIAYTLDVGVNSSGTFIIECHRLYSTGLYGFSDLKLLVYMFNRAYLEIKKM